MNDERSEIARTVLGDVDPARLGVTLMHEHVIHRISIHSGNPDHACIDVDLAARELARFREAGGGTICDVTPLDVGRDPVALREVSRQSGVHVVSALGLYLLEVWPDWMRAMSRAQLADHLVLEAEGGASGVPAGLLGEIVSHNEMELSDWRRYELREDEVRAFQAVADAQRRTGLFVSTHAAWGRNGVAQLRVIADAGGDPSRVIVGHCDAMAHDDPALDFDYYDRLLEFGATIEFDLFSWADRSIPEALRIERLAGLVRRGHADRIVLGTDTTRFSQLHANGGRGFDYLQTFVVPALREAGVCEADIRMMTVTNPARVLGLPGP